MARSIRDCNYSCHEVVTKTEVQLIAEGFDADRMGRLPQHTGAALGEGADHDNGPDAGDHPSEREALVPGGIRKMKAAGLG